MKENPPGFLSYLSLSETSLLSRSPSCEESGISPCQLADRIDLVQWNELRRGHSSWKPGNPNLVDGTLPYAVRYSPHLLPQHGKRKITVVLSPCSIELIF